MKRFFSCAVLSAFILLCVDTRAQGPAGVTCKQHPRTWFISHDIRPEWDKDHTARGRYVIPLTFTGADVRTTAFDIPVLWLDREIFLRITGMSGLSLEVNGREAGTSEDSRSVSEFRLTDLVREGNNQVRIISREVSPALEQTRDVPEAYIFSQPKVRIVDFEAHGIPDSTGLHSELCVTVRMENTYNFAEDVKVGYDIYSPEGKLLYFYYRDVTIPGNSTEDLNFRQPIYNTAPNLWSAENPKLYKLTMTVSRGGRMTEYLPFDMGFGTTELKDGKVYRNGKELALRPVEYSSTPDRDRVMDELKKIKAEGYNLLMLSNTQPDWFYESCCRIGLYVFDPINIDPIQNYQDRMVGGTPANDPDQLGRFIDRAANAYFPHRNYPCVIGWILGNNVGNGYNMYKAYQYLKEKDPSRPVVYIGSEGEWNTDMAYPGTGNAVTATTGGRR